MALLDFPHFAATSSLLPRCCQHCWVMVLSSLRRSRDERIHFPQFKVQSQMNKSQDAAHYNAVECSNGTLPSTAGTRSATKDPNHTCLMADSWLQYDGSKQQQKRLKLLPPQQHIAVTRSPQPGLEQLYSHCRESPFMLGLWGNMKQRYPSLSNILNFHFQSSCLGAWKNIVLFLLPKLIS